MAQASRLHRREGREVMKARRRASWIDAAISSNVSHDRATTRPAAGAASSAEGDTGGVAALTRVCFIRSAGMLHLAPAAPARGPASEPAAPRPRKRGVWGVWGVC